MHMAARLGIGGPGPMGAEAARSMTRAPKQ
jgi:hypothetical protein